MAPTAKKTASKKQPTKKIGPPPARRKPTAAAAPRGAAPACRRPHPHVLHFPGLFSARELARIRAHFDSAKVRSALEPALMHEDAAGDPTTNERKSDVSFWPLGDVPGALSRKLRAAARAADDRLKLLPRTKAGVVRIEYEDLQYAEYDGAKKGHFAQWHTDGGVGGYGGGADDDDDDPEDTREISVVALLAEPKAEFDGGRFEICTGGRPDGERAKRGNTWALDWAAGDAVAFPAKKLWHRVTKVTRGRRASAVLWASAPSGVKHLEERRW